MMRNKAVARRGGPQNMGKVLKRLLSYMKGKYRRRFLLVVLCIIISSLASVSTALFMQTLIDDYILPMLNGSGQGFAALLQAITRLACILVAGALAALFQSRLMVTIGQGIQKEIRDDMFAHMQTLPLSYFDTHAHGDIMSHYTNDIDTLRQLISQSIPSLISSAFTVTAVLLAMLFTNFWLTLVELLGIWGLLMIMRLVTSRSGKYFVKQQQALAKVNGYIEEMINGQKVVKVFCHEEAAKEGFDKVNDALTEDAAKANTYANILMPIMANMGNLLYVLVAMAGGLMAIAGVGGMTLGGIGTFIQLTKSFVMPISQVGQQLNFVIMGFAGAERIFRLMDEASEWDEGDVTLVNVKENEAGEKMESQERTGKWAWKIPEEDGSFTYTPLAGDVRFHDVDFSYVPGKQILYDINLYAHPGHKIAFVGATGAGKTTITNLINRFYDVQDGEITYDGVNVKRIRKGDLRRSLGLVLQDVHLFTGTVRENIRYGRLDATDAEVEAAAKLANAHDFITRLPDGYDTMLSGDGGSLSQGQRQLISIARAAVAEPPVMILDEATSSIDTHTEGLVQAGMDQLMQGRTVFVIAHRLSTVQNANVIMVLQNGHIIERGTHESLLEQKGNYWKLYTGGLEDEA